MAGKPPLRVRMAISSDRRFKQTMNGLRAVHQGVWLGLLDSDALAAANAAAYERWEQFRDDDYNRSGLAEWERDAVERHFRSGSSVLVPSAGAGRELIGLEDLDFRATGFDPSPALVRIGQRLLPQQESNSALSVSPPDRVPADFNGPFDAILFGWGGYIHIQNRATRVAFLSDLRTLVDAGAPMIISFFLRSPDDRTFTASRKIATTIRKVRRSHETVELGDTVAGTFDHHFTWGEIEAELADGGFIVLETSATPYPHLVCRAV